LRYSGARKFAKQAFSARDPASGYNRRMFEKPRPNHRQYIEVLRRMTPQQRLAKAFELNALSKQLFKEGLRRRFPDLPEENFHRLYLERLAKCHNRNY
jgi:hypothetical protein